MHNCVKNVLFQKMRWVYFIVDTLCDRQEGKECKPMTQYARKDYVSLRMLGSFVSGTIGFALILVTWGIYSMNQLMENLNAMDIQELLTSVLVKYIVFMIAYMAITYFVYNRRYTKGRREVKKYYGNLKKLNQLYEREDKLKMSENKDWE